jgi:hypothetical protein
MNQESVAMATNGKDDHETKCLPSGVPRMHLHPTFRKIVQLPQLIVILLERNASYRQNLPRRSPTS